MPLTLEELGNALLDSVHTAAAAVGTNRAALLEQPPGTLDDIGLVAEAVDQDILLLEQIGVLEQTEHLAEKGDGLLVQLLGVANVGRDNLVKGQAGVALVQARTQLLRLDGELTANGIFSCADVRVDVVDGEAAHFRGG